MPRPGARILFALALALAAAVAAPPARASVAPPRRADARRLAAVAGRALQAMTHAGGGPALPAALDAMRRSLAAVDAAIIARSPELFPALSAGSRALAGLRFVAGRSTLSAADAASLRTLADAWALLRGTYGPEGVRHRQGGPLTEAEERRLQALQRAHARLARELAPLAAEAGRTGDRAGAAELASLADRARAIAAATPNLEVLLLAATLGDEMQGEWAAASQLAATEARAARHRLDPVVESLSADAGAGYVFALDLGAEQSWSFLDQETEVPEALAAALEPERPAPAAAPQAKAAGARRGRAGEEASSADLAWAAEAFAAEEAGGEQELAEPTEEDLEAAAAAYADEEPEAIPADADDEGTAEPVLSARELEEAAAAFAAEEGVTPAEGADPRLEAGYESEEPEADAGGDRPAPPAATAHPKQPG